MTERDDERIVSRRYRELPHEEPPSPLDDAIRARARESGDTVPAPLVPPVGRGRWYFPVAAAAILVLAVAVTWQVEREQGDAYVVSMPAEPPVPPRPAEAQVEKAPEPPPSLRARDQAALARKPAKEERSAGIREEARASAPVPAAPAAREDAARPQLGAAARSETMAQRAFSETPEQILERIAKLRAEGRHDEADKALAEFRKRYPDFRIPPELLQKVEKR